MALPDGTTITGAITGRSIGLGAERGTLGSCQPTSDTEAVAAGLLGERRVEALTTNGAAPADGDGDGGREHVAALRIPQRGRPATTARQFDPAHDALMPSTAAAVILEHHCVEDFRNRDTVPADTPAAWAIAEPDQPAARNAST